MSYRLRGSRKAVEVCIAYNVHVYKLIVYHKQKFIVFVISEINIFIALLFTIYCTLYSMKGLRNVSKFIINVVYKRL
jgi:hypothetical protein